jgi:biopolymer transport protein ExbB/TolQ
MNLRTTLLALSFVFLAAFVLLNWGAFSAPTALSLGLVQIQAPLGLIMLVVTGLLSGLFLVYIVFQQAGVILEARRYAKELQLHRELADRAEASRFTEMQAYVADELKKLRAEHAADAEQASSRLQQLERQVLERLDESTRTLSAYVGEVDDKLDRALIPRQS